MNSLSRFPLIVGLLAVLFGSGFTPISLKSVANTSRVDARAADGRGGWLDLGSNDLHVLKDGYAQLGGIEFELLPMGDENSRNCLILARQGAEAATLQLSKPNSEGCLYLLHATARGPAVEKRQVIGTLDFEYTDGTHSETTVRQGEDVAGWMDSASYPNAVRGWTAYNHHTQVSLYVSRFRWQHGRKLKAVTFKANGTCPWMILSATISGNESLRALGKQMEIKGTYRSPRPPEGLKRFPAGKRPKNIILIIGDGMGQALAEIASYYKYGKADSAYFQQFPIAGIATTFSASAPITDSAASATALATGIKTSNGILGLQVDAWHDREHALKLESYVVRARAAGYAVGLVTTEGLFGATPSGFYAHSLDRRASELIMSQALDSGYEVLVGSAATESYLLPQGENNGARKDGRNLVAEMPRRGYQFCRSISELSTIAPDRKVFGALTDFKDGVDEEALAKALKPILARLAKSPKGFFIMAECAGTDHAAHANNAELAVAEVSKVEFAAAAAIDFAQSREDTLVLVTADHTTGGPIVVQSGSNDRKLVVDFTSVHHTSMPVPVHAYGPGAERFEGLIDNTDIARNIQEILEAE